MCGRLFPDANSCAVFTTYNVARTTLPEFGADWAETEWRSESYPHGGSLWITPAIRECRNVPQCEKPDMAAPFKGATVVKSTKFCNERAFLDFALR